MKAFQCDLCEKFENGNPKTITVSLITYEICDDCLAKIKALISKIEKQASEEK